MNRNNKKVIQVGIDFDGVLAYNPFRIIRAPVTYFKRSIVGKKETQFFIPRTDIDKWIWTILHESSVFPAQGVELLRTLVEDQIIQAHLVTARYSFLQPQLYTWLKKHKLETLFTTITINKNDLQPHVYKDMVIREKKFDYFIEDNLDIVAHISQQKHTKVLWIYNILDRHHSYQYKFPYLEKALEHISST